MVTESPPPPPPPRELDLALALTHVNDHPLAGDNLTRAVPGTLAKACVIRLAVLRDGAPRSIEDQVLPLCAAPCARPPSLPPFAPRTTAP